MSILIGGHSWDVTYRRALLLSVIFERRYRVFKKDGVWCIERTDEPVRRKVDRDAS